MTVAADIALVQAAATDRLTDANAFLNTLLAVTTNGITSLYEREALLPGVYGRNGEPGVSFPIVAGGIRPTVSTVGTGPPEAPSIVLSTPAEIVMPTDDLLAPTSNFTFFEAAYQSTLLDPLKVKLLADLTNGGYGIDTADELALFQRTRDRETELAMTRIDEAGRAMAARGFPLPPGELSIVIDRGYQELQAKMSSVSREIFTNSAARFVENRKFTIQEVRTIETVLLGFHNSVQERAFNVAKATVELSIVVYNALLARYRLRLDAAKISSDVALARVQIDLARAQAAIELFRGQILAYEVNIRRQLEPLKIQADLYRADIESNKGLTDGYRDLAGLQQKSLLETRQQNIQISQLTIEDVKAKMMALIQGTQLAMEAAKFGSQQFFTLLAAIWSSLNTLTVQSKEEA